MCCACHWLQRKPLVSDSRDACRDRLTRGGGENVPCIPGACAIRNFTYLARRPCYFLSLSSGCRITHRCWADPVASVSKMRLIFFDCLFCNIWGYMCSTGPFEFMWLKWYICNPTSHHQIGRVNHQPLFRVRSWNNDARCMSYYVLMCWSLYTSGHVLAGIWQALRNVMFQSRVSEKRILRKF